MKIVLDILFGIFIAILFSIALTIYACSMIIAEKLVYWIERKRKNKHEQTTEKENN